MTEITGPPGEVVLHYETDGLELDVTVRSARPAAELVQRATYAALAALTTEVQPIGDEMRVAVADYDLKHTEPYGPDNEVAL